MRKILIIDSNPIFSAMLEKALSKTHAVASCREVSILLQEAVHFRPDILILDLTLPELDGIGFLHTLRQMGLTCRVITTARYISDPDLEHLEALRVDYLLIRPCILPGILSRVLELELQDASSDARMRAAALLLRMGFEMGSTGARYVLEGLAYLLDDPRCSICKDLYPAVARLCGTTPAGAEKTMRSSIHKAQSHQDTNLWGLYFPVGKDGRVAELTTSRFLIRMVAALEAELYPAPKMLGS